MVIMDHKAGSRMDWWFPSDEWFLEGGGRKHFDHI